MKQAYLLKSVPLRLYATYLAFNGLPFDTCLDWSNVIGHCYGQYLTIYLTLQELRSHAVLFPRATGGPSTLSIALVGGCYRGFYEKRRL